MFHLGLSLLVLGLLLRLWSVWGLAVFALGVLVWVWAVLVFGWQRWRGVPLPFVSARHRPARLRADAVVVEPDRPVPLDSPELPPSIRNAVLQHHQPGDVLWRCLRQSGRHKGLVVEWWLMSADGDFIEAFWVGT